MYGKSAPFFSFHFFQASFYLQLRIDQWVVGTATFNQLVMRADLCDDSIVHNGDLVRIDHSGQSMGYEDTRSTLTCSVECILDNLTNIQLSYKQHSLVTFSLSASSALVASSSSRIFGFLINARAIAIRCFCPPGKIVNAPLDTQMIRFTW